MALPFKGADYLNLDGELSEEERMIRDTVRGWVTKEVIPVVARHFREGTFRKEWTPQVAEMGLLGASLQGYGCAGLSNVAYGIAMQELERGDSGLRSFVSVQGGLVMYPIHAFGSEEQKKKWLPEMAAGRKIGCFGLTEPDFGSDPGGMLTTARKDGDHYVLDGTKMWITNGGISDVAVVWAKLDGVVRGFLVETGTPGYKTADIEGKFSLRASVTSELSFDGCRIPAGNLLPGTGGLKSPLMCLNQARYGISWGALGAAMACYSEALEYAKTRIQFKRPIAGFQLVQKKLVEMVTEITKGQLLALRVGRMKDKGEAKPHHISMAKMNNVSIALHIARMARDVLGANGVADEYQSFRHMANLESVYTYEGTHDIHTLVIGENITGISAFNG